MSTYSHQVCSLSHQEEACVCPLNLSDMDFLIHRKWRQWHWTRPGLVLQGPCNVHLVDTGYVTRWSWHYRESMVWKPWPEARGGRAHSRHFPSLLAFCLGIVSTFQIICFSSMCVVISKAGGWGPPVSSSRWDWRIGKEGVSQEPASCADGCGDGFGFQGSSLWP